MAMLHHEPGLQKNLDRKMHSDSSDFQNLKPGKQMVCIKD
jgi:hypothetical protein